LNQIDLSGRRAIITGGAQGIGRAIAERFRISGAEIAIWDRDASLLQSAAKEMSPGIAVHPITVDVSVAGEVEKAMSATLAVMKRVDILVANAGIAGPNHTLWEYPLEQWRQVIDVNLNGVFLCCRAVVPLMIQQNYGRIVNVASIAGKEGNPKASAYSASKSGVIALTKSLGKELAGYNIAANCVTPAAAKTNIFDQITQQHIDFMLSKIPRGRFARIEEIAAMVAWLASEENSFATGAVFDLSGGRATY